MTQSIFISENWLKSNTPLPANMDVKEIYPFYKIAQDKHIRDILGDDLYNRLCAGLVLANLNADETALLVLIRPCLAYFILHESIPFLHTKIKNIGINSTQDDKQINADIARVRELRHEILGNAEYYKNRVLNYLCKNHALYPEYNFSNDDVNPNTKAGYSCDLYIDPNFIDEKFIKNYWKQ